MLLLLNLSEFNLNQWRKQPLPCCDLFLALHQYYSKQEVVTPFFHQGRCGSGNIQTLLHSGLSPYHGQKLFKLLQRLARRAQSDDGRLCLLFFLLAVKWRDTIHSLPLLVKTSQSYK